MLTRNRFSRVFFCERALISPVFAFIVSIGIATSAMADLSAGDQKLLADAQQHLKQSEANLKLAQQSAGRGTKKPTGSKAKLSMMRLNSAKQSLAQVTARLAKLPADDAAVQALQKSYDGVAAAMAKLEERLTGQAPSTDTSAEQGVKLDYRQEEELKNARYYLREIEGLAESVAASADAYTKAKDQNLIPYLEVAGTVAKINKAFERAGLFRNHIDPLPEDGRGVKALMQQFHKAGATIHAAQQAVTPIHEKLQSLTNPANYPELVAHTERLRELTTMFGNPRILVENREQAAEIIGQAPAAAEERVRLVKKYALLIHQQTPEGKRLNSISNYFTKQFLTFSTAAQKERESLPSQIEADLERIRKMGERAVAEKKPAFFTNGIPQELVFVDEKLALYEVLDPEGVRPLKDKLAQTQEQFKKDRVALRDLIIDSNNLPPDAYTGADRDEVVKIATNAWKKREPDAKVLAARIPSQQWKHEVLWRNQTDSWYKIDRSRLQVQLVVRHDDKLAAVQPIDLWKDHMSGDQVEAFPFHKEGYELQPQSLMLLSKVK